MNIRMMSVLTKCICDSDSTVETQMLCILDSLSEQFSLLIWSSCQN